MTKFSLQLEVPDFISIEQYREINSYKGDSALQKMVHAVSKITDKSVEEVSSWSIDSLKNIIEVYQSIADHKQQFHSIIEWNGQLYGYAHMKQASNGEYIDLESLCKDLNNNMHKVAAVLYRPITTHRFKDMKFIVKQKIKMANNDVENVFDWYEIEKYDSVKRKQREEEFKQFPVHIFLGAVSFFLTNASQYLNSIAFSENKITKRTMNRMHQDLMRGLLASTGAGGGLSTTSLSPIFYKYQATGLS